MKKMLVILVLFVVLVSQNTNTESFSLLNYFSGEYYAYSHSPISENYVDLGSCVMNYGKVENNKKLIGESMIVADFEPVACLKDLEAKVVKTEIIETGAEVIYAYTNLIKDYVSVSGKKVNIQIAHYETYSVIGWPLILGSF